MRDGERERVSLARSGARAGGRGRGAGRRVAVSECPRMNDGGETRLSNAIVLIFTLRLDDWTRRSAAKASQFVLVPKSSTTDPSPDPAQTEYMSTNKMSPSSGKEAVPAGGLAQLPPPPQQQHLPVPVPESQPAAANASRSAPAIASTISMAVPVPVPVPIPIPAVSAGLVASDTKVPPPPATTTGAPTTAAAAAAPPASNAAAAKAGTKRSAPIASLPPLDRSGRNLSEKKIRRLEKNRLSARECRRKKKEAAQNMEREINLLEAENLRLRLQLQVSAT